MFRIKWHCRYIWFILLICLVSPHNSHNDCQWQMLLLSFNLVQRLHLVLLWSLNSNFWTSKDLEDFDSEVNKDYAKSSDSISLVALWMTQAGSKMNRIMVKWMWNREQKERDRPVIHFIKHNHLPDTKAPQLPSSFWRTNVEWLSNLVAALFVSSSARTSGPKAWTA